MCKLLLGVRYFISNGHVHAILQAFMRKLAAAVKPRPASLDNYNRMRAPRELPKLEVVPDKQLGRVNFFRQVQVGGSSNGLTVPCVPTDSRLLP